MNYHKVYMNHVHSSSLLCQLCTMWKSQTLCDAVIRTGTIITKAHRVVLVAACPMLQSLENATSGSHLEVRLAADIKQESVNTFLQYLYEGFMMLTEENCKDVEKIARLLQVDSVIRCCADFNKCLNVSAGQQYKYSSLDQAEFRHMRTTDILKVQEKSQKRFADTGRPPSPGSKRQRLHRPSSPLKDISMQVAGHQIHDTESMSEGYGVGANDPWDRVPRIGSGFPGATSKPGVIDIREDSLELIQTEPPKDAGGGRVQEQRKVQSSVGISVASQHNTSADLRIVNVSEGQTTPKSSAAQQSGTSSSARQITVSPLMQIDSPSSSSSVDSSKFSSDRFSSSSQRKDPDRPPPHSSSVNIPAPPVPTSHPPPSSMSEFPQTNASPGRPRPQESFMSSTPQRLPYPVSLTAVRPTLSAQKPFAAGSATQAGMSQSFTEGMHQTPPTQRPQQVSKPASRNESLERPPSSGQESEGKSKGDEAPSTSDLTPDISIVKVESAGSSVNTAVDVDELNMYINEAVAEASRERQGDDHDPDASSSNFEVEEPPSGDWSHGDMSNEGGNLTADQSGNWYPGGQFKGDQVQFGMEEFHQESSSTAKAPLSLSSGSEFEVPEDLSCYVLPSGSMVVASNLYCHPCNKRFTSSTTLSRHLRIFHSDRAVPQCKLCGKRTSSWYDLKVHEKSHSTERPYKCEECQKSYKYKQDLKSHMNVFHPKGSHVNIEESKSND